MAWDVHGLFRLLAKDLGHSGLASILVCPLFLILYIILKALVTKACMYNRKCSTLLTCNLSSGFCVASLDQEHVSTQFLAASILVVFRIWRSTGSNCWSK